MRRSGRRPDARGSGAIFKFDSWLRLYGIGFGAVLMRGGFALGPGLAPAATFFAARQERRQPPQSATPTLRVGAHLGRDAGGVRCGIRCALRASLKQPQRSRSMRDFAHATPPPPSPQGSPVEMTPAIAALGSGAGATRREVQAERSDGPWGFKPLAVPEERRAGAGACAEGHAPLSDLPRLFERSRRRAVSYAAPPRARAPQAAPERSAGDTDSRGVLCLLFLHEQEKEVARRGASPGPGKQSQNKSKNSP